MNTPIEYDSIWGNTHCGVPSPWVPHVSLYPTRFHGPVWRYAQQTNAYAPAVLERAAPYETPGARAARQPPSITRVPGARAPGVVRAIVDRVRPALQRATAVPRSPTGAPLAGLGVSLADAGPLGVAWGWWGAGAAGLAALAFVVSRRRMTPNRCARRNGRRPGRRASYVTTFCNQPHDMATGRPIGHECYVLPPTMLFAERGGDFDLANFILASRGKGPVVRGRGRAA